jgi:hypothetical protein
MNSAKLIFSTLLLAAAPCVTALGTDRLVWMPIDAPTPSAESCKVARSEAAMTKTLTRIGARNTPDGVDFKKNVALIVTTRIKNAKPDHLDGTDPSFTLELLDDGNFRDGTGTVVVAVATRAGNTCSVAHFTVIAKRDQEEARRMGMHSVQAYPGAPETRSWEVEENPTLASKALRGKR